MKTKKGSGLSFNMLVMMIFGLVAMILIGAIAMGKIRFFSANVEGDCEARGGLCIDTGNCLAQSGAPGIGKCDDDMVCCLSSCASNEGQCRAGECSDGEIMSFFICKTSDDKCCMGG